MLKRRQRRVYRMAGDRWIPEVPGRRVVPYPATRSERSTTCKPHPARVKAFESIGLPRRLEPATHTPSRAALEGQ